MYLTNTIFKMSWAFIVASVLILSTPAQAAMSTYCVTPPFLSQNIPPNVLIVLDNSLSMCDQAYAGTFNENQFSSHHYYGYFDGTKNYKYNGSRWEVTTDALNTGTNANPIATGSFLNWATMRRVEVAKKLLVGGKGNPRSWNGSVSVKLEGETGCASSWDFSKDYNTGAGNVIYPFTGSYRFAREDGNLLITPLASGATSFDTRPNGDVSVPSGWSEYPVSGALVAYTKVDETTSDGNTTYIQNNNTTEPVLLDYNYTQSKPAGTITVTVKIIAKRTASGSTRKIRGVLRIGGVNYESNTESLGDNYDLFSFNWTSNPATGLPWDWNDIKASGVGSIQAFGVKADGLYTSKYPRITQVYLNVSVASPSGGPYGVTIDMGSQNATGIIDTLTGEVKFGLAYYASSNDGGKIDTYPDFNTPTSMITSIQNMTPATYTPLGETLFEMASYFTQTNPYYGNSPADYQTGLNYDPYYYDYTDPNVADRYVPCAKSFILMLTDGESTKDENIPGTHGTSPYAPCSFGNIKGCSGYGGSPNNPNPRFAGTSIGSTYSSNGTDYLIDVAYWMRANDMRDGTCTSVPTTWNKCIPLTQNITLYSVYMFGSGSTLLKDAAIYGGFNDLNGNGKPDCITTPAECYKDSSGDGVVRANGTDNPLTYYEGEDGEALQTSITSAIADILKRVTSGTAASVLASGEGSGANLIQATYYPKRQFGNDEINWIGSLQNLWYYVDPYYTYSNIREEGGDTNKDYILDLKADGLSSSGKDYILQLYFDTTAQKAKAKRFYDSLGTGATGTQIDTIEFETLGNLWNAGTLLWSRDLSSSPRTLKTWLDANGNGVVDSGEFINFTQSAYSALTGSNKTILKTALQAADDVTALKTISYVNGYDKFCSGTSTGCLSNSDCTSPATCTDSTFRSRTVAVDLNGDGDTLDSGESAKVWKLGDIVNSTPGTSSWMRLNKYDSAYGDLSYNKFINDIDTTVTDTNSTARYKNRGMVFVGANDGMLHAFKLGKLGLKWSSQTETQKATLGKYCADNPSTACVLNTDCATGTCASDTDLGKEIWAFIPKNVLPYLAYMQDPSYCHIYSVDLAPFIFDASIEGPSTTCSDAGSDYWKCSKNRNSWRTIIIAGMRSGGACKETTYGGSTDAGVKVPVSGVGYSSYFALDITDPYNPSLLWEFSDPALGFATTGPAVMRIGSRTAGATTSTVDTATSTDGRWFVVLGSGPTGGINTSESQFLGNSDQNLRLFILDLKTGSLVRTIDTGITNAFAGSMLNAVQDSDMDYQDDVAYIPYVRKCAVGDTSTICDSSEGLWNNGGVLRLLTNEDNDGNDVSGGIGGTTALNPATWQYGVLIDDAGPVTSSVVRLQSKSTGKLWTYFGSGRYFYKLNTTIDDSDHVRQLYGLKDPCFDNGYFTSSCLGGTGSSVAPGDLASVNTSTTVGVTATVGWKIALDGCTTAAGASVACSSAYFRPERVITNPLSVTTGVVFFTTLKPFDDICSPGGNTAIWAVQYDNGAAAGSLLQGKALIQVSTGAIEQKDLATAFTEKGGRKTTDIQGVPPTSQGLSIIGQPRPVKRVLHTRER